LLIRRNGEIILKLKQKKSKSSIVLYVAASIIAILGTLLLISNVILYHNNVIQYVAQGNSVSTVTAQLIPTQLIPGIFGPICTYWGIALLLIAIAIINEKVSKCLAAVSTNDEVPNIVVEKNTVDIQGK
jgi:hypothetical protein